MKDARPVSGADRRGLLLAVAGCVTAAAVLLLATGLVWLDVAFPARPPLPGVSESLTGQDVSDSLVPIGLLVGAAGLALIATRRIGRFVVAFVLLAAGILALAITGFFLYDGGFSAALSWAQARATTVGESALPNRNLSVGPAVLALSGAGLSLAVGLLTILRGRRWPVMGSRYERRTRPVEARSESDPPVADPAATADPSQPVSEAAIWTALDRGEDPTAPPRGSPQST